MWHNIFGIAAGVLSQICVAIINPNWFCMWMPALFVLGSIYIQPEGWLGKAIKGKEVLIVEITCYIDLIGSLLERYI